MLESWIITTNIGTLTLHLDCFLRGRIFPLRFKLTCISSLKMKYILFIFLGLFFYSPILAQEKPVKRQEISIEFGVPHFLNSNINKQRERRSFSIGYQYNFSKRLSGNLFYRYAHTNNFPSFFHDQDKLLSYVQELPSNRVVYVNEFAFVESHSIGFRTNLNVITNGTWVIGLFCQGGRLFAQTSSFSLNSIFDIYATSIIDYKNQVEKNEFSNWFYGGGVQAVRRLDHAGNYSLGVRLDMIGTYFSEEVVSYPVLPDYMQASLLISRKF